MTDVDPRWVEVLDRLEANMRGYADALERLDAGTTHAGPGHDRTDDAAPGTGARPLVPALDPPSDLGPIPADLAARARQVLAHLELLEAQVRGDRDAIAADLGSLRAHSRAPRGQAEPSLFDATA